MQAVELKTLVEEIHRQRTEKQPIELKAAHGGFPGKIYDTLSSFSNRDDGGIMVFGVTDKPEFKVVGVYDAEDTQKQIMEQYFRSCR
ncbi:MAG: ATP-binding protein [Oscillospiraceae bacterium]|nr:ATP-binding protein [Oscillospiraceae bacterium]